MRFGRQQWSTASLLILMVKVISGHTLKCQPAEYQIRDECCPLCPAGSRVKTDCKVDRSTSCLPCLSGTYMDHPTGLKKCLICTNCDKGSGLKTKKPCTITSDTVCEPLEGFYCAKSSDNDCDVAKKHRSCEPGQYISKKGTASSDSECSDCSDGTFSDGSFTSCRPHTQCESDLQVLRQGTASADAECGEEDLKKKTIWIILSVVVFLALIVCTVFFVRWKRKRKR
ncbi:tumor necrosis factor receptor superfamily member 14-like isoform X1 [Betta splendens]|uniref:Tumor necrosis factor receptor superfamily member 14-like isoform X1 n=1 Tax=Betta splendens TaxID=158456 RepID=A0A6P7MY79_BETSP|nr:tumor necrosis factor receptor superfamily member 14-like isoform X1 [Betta splendens]